MYVFDVNTGGFFPTSVRNVGAKRDFNRIENEEHKPDILEEILASLEAEFARVLKWMTVSKSMPTGHDRIILFNFMALYATRTPLIRKKLTDFQAIVSERMLELTLANKERYDAQMRHLNKGEYEESQTVSYEEVKDFFNSKKYEIVIPNARNIRFEMVAMDSVLRTLLERKWTLAVAKSEVGQFVTSDNPVTLDWMDMHERSPTYPPGHGLKGTRVIFPVTPELVLMGAFEGNDQTVEVDRNGIAAINRVIASFSVKQVYSSQRSVLITGPNGAHNVTRIKI